MQTDTPAECFYAKQIPERATMTRRLTRGCPGMGKRRAARIAGLGGQLGDLPLPRVTPNVDHGAGGRPLHRRRETVLKVRVGTSYWHLQTKVGRAAATGAHFAGARFHRYHLRDLSLPDYATGWVCSLAAPDPANCATNSSWLIGCENIGKSCSIAPW